MIEKEITDLQVRRRNYVTAFNEGPIFDHFDVDVVLAPQVQVDPRDISRLEVETETLFDKSKAVKSVLIQLFAPVNAIVEDDDNVNNCYGGMNAHFDVLNVVESPAGDGRPAIIVAGDGAVNNRGIARSTHGVGAVAKLIGSTASISLRTGIRGSFMQHKCDFSNPTFEASMLLWVAIILSNVT